MSVRVLRFSNCKFKLSENQRGTCNLFQLEILNIVIVFCGSMSHLLSGKRVANLVTVYFNRCTDNYYKLLIVNCPDNGTGLAQL